MFRLLPLIAMIAMTSEYSFAETLGVYGDTYVASNGDIGFSIYRVSDHKDIGNAYADDPRICDQAALVANQFRNGVVCAPYYHKAERRRYFSLYRIIDGEDLGPVVIGTFNECQLAVKFVRNGHFCSTFRTEEGYTYWAKFDLKTNSRLGNELYSFLETCGQNL